MLHKDTLTCTGVSFWSCRNDKGPKIQFFSVINCNPNTFLHMHIQFQILSNFIIGGPNLDVIRKPHMKLVLYLATNDNDTEPVDSSLVLEEI